MIIISNDALIIYIYSTDKLLEAPLPLIRAQEKLLWKITLGPGLSALDFYRFRNDTATSLYSKAGS